MTQQIAFLRAINVGGRFVKMDVLRTQFETLGLRNVATYIQSGNVLFDTSDRSPVQLEQEIEAQLQDSLDYAVPTFLRTSAELIEIARYNPFADVERGPKATLYVSFLRSPPDNETRARLEAYSSDVDLFHAHGAHVFWLWQRHLGESAFTNTKLEKVLGMPATRRNMTTVQKIVAKYFLAEK